MHALPLQYYFLCHHYDIYDRKSMHLWWSGCGNFNCHSKEKSLMRKNKPQSETRAFMDRLLYKKNRVVVLITTIVVVIKKSHIRLYNFMVKLIELGLKFVIESICSNSTGLRWPLVYKNKQQLPHPNISTQCKNLITATTDHFVSVTVNCSPWLFSIGMK